MADAEAVKVGSRVWVRDKDLYGVVRFFGTTHFAPGKWIGVELEDARGKNSGSVGGKEYFSCSDNHGLFVRPTQVQVVVDAPPPSEPEAATLKIGARVWLKDKDLYGFVRFFGTTHFAPGKWIGVELEDARGKNDGSVAGKEYFSCSENHGLFVRPTQVQVVMPSPNVSRLAPPTAGMSPGLSRRSGSFGGKKSPAASPPQRSGRRKSKEPAPVTTQAAPSTVPAVESTDAEVEEASGEVVDLQQKLAILQQKRQEDKAKLKELEKYRIQVHQLMEYKVKWSESQTDLQQQLKVAKKEARDAFLAKERAEEEFRELADAVEMATLDKEMAEERCENLQQEAEALKEKVEELTIDLEIIKQEISDSGLEGVATNAEVKQLEQQNSRLKEALVRLRDLSAQEKLEHQRVVKDLDKAHSELKQFQETRDKLQTELKESEALVDELKEQVDAALGAEEMVETLTNKNLDLEEKLEQLTETVTDLEALRDLSEEQEELRAEVEHDLREEIDMTQNRVRQLERKVDASQETIVDQQQTIEKFRELVQHMQGEMADLRQRGESQREGAGSPQAQAVINLNAQLKSTAMKETSRTVEFELRKLEAQQAVQLVDLFKTFMPNSFLVSGGDYDAILVLMLLPRIVFKAELVIDQLKQQHKLDDALGSLGTVKGPLADQLVFCSYLIYKLSTLQLLVGKAQRILDTCDVQLYRQMGGLRDDLAIHERALDILIELMKKEQLDESVPLHGLEKAIGHFEHLLQSRLVEASPATSCEQLLDQVKVMTSGTDFLTLEMLRLRLLSPEKSLFVTQIKELESFNNDLRVACRKIRRKVPSPGSSHALRYDSTVEAGLVAVRERQLQLISTMKTLHIRCSQRASSLTEGEHLTGGELEEYVRRVVTTGPLQGAGPDTMAPKDTLRLAMSTNSKTMEKFLSALQDGEYDAPPPKTKPKPPVTVRGEVVKGELSDVEGLGFKLEERQKIILQLRTTLKMKAEELSEAGVKISRLEKKVEGAEDESARKVEKEREEVARFKVALEEQERKFNKTIEILQGDIESLENDKIALEKKLDHESKRTMLADATTRRMLGGRGSPFGSPFAAARSEEGRGEGARGEVQEGAPSPDIGHASPLLLARVDSLSKALSFSQDENLRLKTEIAKAQLSSLPPLVVPKRLVHKGWRTGEREEEEEERVQEGEGVEVNQTDQEKSVVKETANLLEELNRMALPQVIDITKKDEKGPTPREKLANQLASVLEMKRRKQKLLEEGSRVMASQYPGGLATTRVTAFPSPQFLKALGEGPPTPNLSARLRLPAGRRGVSGGGRVHSLTLSPAQLATVHSAIIG